MANVCPDEGGPSVLAPEEEVEVTKVIQHPHSSEEDQSESEHDVDLKRAIARSLKEHTTSIRQCRSCDDETDDSRWCSECRMNVCEDPSCVTIHPGQRDTAKKRAPRVCTLCYEVIFMALDRANQKRKPLVIRKGATIPAGKSSGAAAAASPDRATSSGPDPTAHEPIFSALEGTQLSNWLRDTAAALVSYFLYFSYLISFRKHQTPLSKAVLLTS